MIVISPSDGRFKITRDSYRLFLRSEARILGRELFQRSVVDHNLYAELRAFLKIVTAQILSLHIKRARWPRMITPMRGKQRAVARGGVRDDARGENANLD